MFHIASDRVDDLLVVTCKGELTIYQGSEIRQKYLEALDEPVNRYELDLSGVTGTDLSAVQLVLGFMASVKARKKTLTVRPLSRENAFRSTAGRLGLRPDALFPGEAGSDGF